MARIKSEFRPKLRACWTCFVKWTPVGPYVAIHGGQEVPADFSPDSSLLVGKYMQLFQTRSQDQVQLTQPNLLWWGEDSSIDWEPPQKDRRPPLLVASISVWILTWPLIVIPSSAKSSSTLATTKIVSWTYSLRANRLDLATKNNCVSCINRRWEVRQVLPPDRGSI